MSSSINQTLNPDAGSPTLTVSLRELKSVMRKLGKKIVACQCGCGDLRSSPIKGKTTRFIPGHARGWKQTIASRRKRAEAAKQLWETPGYRERLSGENSPLYGRAPEQHPCWRGGRYVRADGYVYRTIAADSPFVSMAWRKKNGGYEIPEHRLVAAETLGRPLAVTDVIHHRSGDPQDNRPENLLVLASHTEHGRLHALLRAGVSEAEAIVQIVLDRYPALTAALV